MKNGSIHSTLEKKLVNDRDLISQFVQDGNPDAFVKLVERYAPEMRRHLFVLLNGSREDMEDAEQDIILSLFQTLPRFRFKSSFKTYFHRLCRNKAVDLIRKKSRDRKVIRLLEDRPVHITAGPEEDFLIKEKKEKVFSIFFKLGQEERSVVLLKDVERFSIREISQVLGINEGTVKSRLHRSREKLARLLKGENYP